MNNESEVEFAVAALNKLEEMHGDFVSFVGKLRTKEVNGGELETDGKSLLITCLGIRLAAAHRPIARDNRLVAIEYPFLTRQAEREVLIWRMFLEADYSLYADANKERRICSFNNDYLASYLIQPITVALLRSPVFAPLSES
jgi:hypothetical protein